MYCSANYGFKDWLTLDYEIPPSLVYRKMHTVYILMRGKCRKPGCLVDEII